MAAAHMRPTPLSKADTAWYRMEHPTNLMVITGVLMFDTIVDFKQLRQVVEERLLRFDRFRQRVVPVSGGLYWEFDRSFDVRAHLHRIALPSPGDQLALEELVSDLSSTPLDYSKPLWQIHLVEGYGAGCALIARLHHSIADGIALVRVLLSLTDDHADASSAGAVPAAADDGDAGALSLARRMLEVVEVPLFGGLDLLGDPSRLLDLFRQGADGVAALNKLLFMPPDPPTLLKGPLGVAKRVAWSQPIALDDLKAIGRITGGTINDVLLSSVTGALRRYLVSRRAPVEGLNIRAVVPVNLRALDEPIELGNRFGLVFIPLPVGVADPLERLFELKERMDVIKGTPEAIVAFGILNAIGTLPPPIQSRVVDMFGSKATAVMTNVPGPRETLYLAGAPVRGIMFWVPQSGRLGLGVSILSYAGNVLVGVAVDEGLIPDPQTIICGFHEEFEQLLRLVHEERAHSVST